MGHYHLKNLDVLFCRFMMVLICLIFSVLSTIDEYDDFAMETLFWMVSYLPPFANTFSIIRCGQNRASDLLNSQINNCLKLCKKKNLTVQRYPFCSWLSNIGSKIKFKYYCSTTFCTETSIICQMSEYKSLDIKFYYSDIKFVFDK